MSTSTLAFDSRGLLPVIAQDRLTGEVRMLAHANAAAVAHTLETGRATFFSRSRGVLWVKGETSGNVLVTTEVLADCDLDALVYLVDPIGPTCHTGSPSCFFRRVTMSSGEVPVAHVDEPVSATTFLGRLEAVLEARRSADGGESYTKSLYEAGAEAIGAKLREEADELARAVGSENSERVTAEAADLLFHLAVALRSRGVAMASVLGELDRRSGTSGFVEKKNRPARAAEPV